MFVLVLLVFFSISSYIKLCRPLYLVACITFLFLEVGFITEFQQARESIAFPLVHRIKQKPTTKDINTLLEFSFSMFAKGNVEATKEARFARLVAGREAQNTANTVQERLEYADLYQTATFLLAPYDVDCFWIALEWGRPYEKAFYLPRRKIGRASCRERV